MTNPIGLLAILEATQDFGDLFDHPSLSDPEWMAALEAAGLGKSTQERENAIRAAQLASNWPQLFKLFCRVGRDFTTPLLLTALFEGDLSHFDYAKAVADCWSGHEWPERVLPRREWLEIWEYAGYSVGGERTRPPTTPLTLHRGAVDDDDAQFGLSWTRSYEQAEWFAERAPRFGFGPGVILTCEVPPECLLADLGAAGREGEREVVVDITKVHPLPQPTRTPFASTRT